MSNVRTFTGPQQEVAGTLPNNYSLGGGNMKADYKVATNIVPNTEARWKDVNTRGRGGDVLRQETQAHEIDLPPNKPHMHAGANESHNKVYSSHQGPDKPDV
ncbi:uncharacterized protein UMAG_05265 [Mycosarcoma maydis]|uniref:Uncharacterized protein n=1 Tax=Mycosarcoma maydis TaxID=5270 RepID=A0A0D1DUJ5_MYCMD|nr:uncharacterized protein UMAG_05265 [Ustilago maydis 521]KIS66265.1 hypothetical protein UMAG_05265 [Ustilago maydis 521]|eukprot:XP_011391987.1 hypothetical protein UMAG_05265 [Ustilago maydis 521]